MQQKRLYPIEIITILYIVFTTLFILFFRDSVKDGEEPKLLLARSGFVALVGGLYLWNWYSNKPVLTLLRNILPLAFILYFYQETYFLNNCLFHEYLDPVFIDLDQRLFGCQPSTLFCEVMPSSLFNELMNFAYISYFFTILGIVVFFLVRDKTTAYRASFIILCSFFIYYIAFIILPVAGPQFYLFDHDTVLPVQGPMRKLLLLFHSFGERPTGAVPSSHCGVMLIYMILLWQHSKRAFWIALPLSFLLMLSTVYLRAHYAIDVLIGLATAPFIYLFANWSWKKLSGRNIAYNL